MCSTDMDHQSSQVRSAAPSSETVAMRESRAKRLCVKSSMRTSSSWATVTSTTSLNLATPSALRTVAPVVFELRCGTTTT